MKKAKIAFTLVELIIVIIIVGILAAIGLTQYNVVVEKSRLAEAKVRIGVMRQLAYEYYAQHGSFIGIQNIDVGVDNTCVSTNFYRYWIGGDDPSWIQLFAERCTSSGKKPDASRSYRFQLWFYPETGADAWHCWWVDDSSSCFGLPGP